MRPEDYQYRRVGAGFVLLSTFVSAGLIWAAWAGPDVRAFDGVAIVILLASLAQCAFMFVFETPPGPAPGLW